MTSMSVGDAPRELRAAVLAMRRADSDVRRAVATDMRQTMNAVWAEAVDSRARTERERRMLTPGTRIAGGNPPQLVAANSKRKVGRGLIPSQHWAGFEYGVAKGSGRRTYDRVSPKGTRHTVTRDVLTGHPSRIRNGRVIGPAVKATLPRIASYWVQSVVRSFLDAADRKN